MKHNKLPYNDKSGFKVPDNYFENFEEKMMRSIGEKPALENIPFQTNSGFKVPEFYFEDLENKIISKAEGEKKNGKLISLFTNTKLYYVAAIAAVFAGVISSVFFNPVNENFTIDGLELSAIEQYIDEGYIDFNYNEISAFMAEEDYSFDDFNTSGLSDEQVFEYLSENIEDPNILYE